MLTRSSVLEIPWFSAQRTYLTFPIVTSHRFSSHRSMLSNQRRIPMQSKKAHPCTKDISYSSKSGYPSMAPSKMDSIGIWQNKFVTKTLTLPWWKRYLVISPSHWWEGIWLSPRLEPDAPDAIRLPYLVWHSVDFRENAPRRHQWFLTAVTIIYHKTL